MRARELSDNGWWPRSPLLFAVSPPVLSVSAKHPRSETEASHPAHKCLRADRGSALHGPALEPCSPVCPERCHVRSAASLSSRLHPPAFDPHVDLSPPQFVASSTVPNP